MSIQPPCWIGVLSTTMRNAPVGSTCGKNAEIAIAAAPTMISPLFTAWLHQRDQRGVHSETAATPGAALPRRRTDPGCWGARSCGTVDSHRSSHPIAPKTPIALG